MRNIAKEISDCHDEFKRHEMLLSAKAEDIFKYYAYCGTGDHRFQSAEAALRIRLSKDADIQTKRLVWFTIGIFVFTVALFILTGALVFLTEKLAAHP